MEALTDIANRQQKIKRLGYLLCGLLWLVLPVLSIFPLTYLWVSDRSVHVKRDHAIIFLFSLTFGLIAYTGQSIGSDETDIFRYHLLYRTMADIETMSAFLVYMALEGGSNPVFYVINFLFSRLFPDNAQVHVCFWITVTYFFTLKGAYLAMTTLGKPIPSAYVKWLIVISLIGIIPLFTVTEIIKQCSSIAILFYAVVRKMAGGRGIWYLILSLLVHTSSLMFLPVYFLYNNRQVKKYFYFILLVSLFFTMVNFNVILTFVLGMVLPGSDLLMRAETYQNIEVWSISLRHYATYFVFLLIVAILFFDAWITRKRGISTSLAPARWQVFMVLFLSFVVLTINMGNVHNFVRYVYGLFPFYILGISAILKSQLQKGQRYTIALLVVLFFSFSNFKLLSVQTSANVNYANSYFDNSWGNILTSNVYEFLKFRIK